MLFTFLYEGWVDGVWRGTSRYVCYVSLSSLRGVPRMSSRYTTIILSMLHVAFKQVGHNVFKYVEVIGERSLQIIMQ